MGPPFVLRMAGRAGKTIGGMPGRTFFARSAVLTIGAALGAFVVFGTVSVATKVALADTLMLR
jgi:hypothetical protein